MSAPVALGVERLPFTRREWFVRALQFGVITFFIGAWEGLGRAGVLDPFYYSRPSLFIPRIGEWFAPGSTAGDIWLDIRVTLTETILGFVVGTHLAYDDYQSVPPYRLQGA